jgi:hypothetical protein
MLVGVCSIFSIDLLEIVGLSGVIQPNSTSNSYVSWITTTKTDDRFIVVMSVKYDQVNHNQVSSFNARLNGITPFPKVKQCFLGKVTQKSRKQLFSRKNVDKN